MSDVIVVVTICPGALCVGRLTLFRRVGDIDIEYGIVTQVEQVFTWSFLFVQLIDINDAKAIAI